MKQWRCRACGKVFQDEGHGAPEGHGDFYITQDGWKQDKCSGTLELLPEHELPEQNYVDISCEQDRLILIADKNVSKRP